MSLIWIMGTPWFPSRYSEQHAPPIILVSWAQSSPGSGAQCVWLRSEGRVTTSGWEVHVRFVPGASCFTGCHSIEENSGRFKIYFLTKREVKIFIHSFKSHPFIFFTHSFYGEHLPCKYLWEWGYLAMYVFYLFLIFLIFLLSLM